MPEVKIESLLRSPLSAIGIKDGQFEKTQRLTWDEVGNRDLIAMRRGPASEVRSTKPWPPTGRKLRPTFEVVDYHGPGVDR